MDALQGDDAPADNTAEVMTLVSGGPFPPAALPTLTASSFAGEPPTPCGTLRQPVRGWRLDFSEAMRDPPGDGRGEDVSNPANYRLIEPGPDRDFATTGCAGAPAGDDRLVPIGRLDYQAAPSPSLTLAFGNDRALPPGLYRLLACGTLHDLGDQPLDGNGSTVRESQRVRRAQSSASAHARSMHSENRMTRWFIASSFSVLARSAYQSGVGGAARRGTSCARVVPGGTSLLIWRFGCGAAHPTGSSVARGMPFPIPPAPASPGPSYTGQVRSSAQEGSGVQAAAAAASPPPEPSQRNTIAPILFGADKFFHLSNWDRYPAPAIAQLSPFSVHQTMYVVGVIDAGVVVAVAPRIGAPHRQPLVARHHRQPAARPGYYDVALRDFGLFLAAVALWRLSIAYSARTLRQIRHSA